MWQKSQRWFLKDSSLGSGNHLTHTEGTEDQPQVSSHEYVINAVLT